MGRSRGAPGIYNSAAFDAGLLEVRNGQNVFPTILSRVRNGLPGERARHPASWLKQ